MWNAYKHMSTIFLTEIDSSPTVALTKGNGTVLGGKSQPRQGDASPVRSMHRQYDVDIMSKGMLHLNLGHDHSGIS